MIDRQSQFSTHTPINYQSAHIVRLCDSQWDPRDPIRGQRRERGKAWVAVGADTHAPAERTRKIGGGDGTGTSARKRRRDTRGRAQLTSGGPATIKASVAVRRVHLSRAHRTVNQRNAKGKRRARAVTASLASRAAADSSRERARDGERLPARGRQDKPTVPRFREFSFCFYRAARPATPTASGDKSRARARVGSCAYISLKRQQMIRRRRERTICRGQTTEANRK